MIVYIKDRVTDEVIAKTENVIAVYGNELIFEAQKYAKAIANSLSDSILFLVHREAKHFISYSAELDHAIITLNKNLMAVVVKNLHDEYEINYRDYIYKLNKFCNEKIK